MTMETRPADSCGRVLFADDDDAAREGMAVLLRRLGYTCECAATADEAIAKLRGAAFEALVSDIHMPGNVSLELVQAVAASMPGLPVILLTGRPSVETAARSVRLPVTAYLTKPPDLDELTRVLDQAIAGYRDLCIIRDGRNRLREWERELAQVEQLAGKSTDAAAGGPMQDYLRVSLRQIILQLSDLERATQVLDRRAEDRLRQVDHIAALQHTVEVLERTRQNFKSKDLADLRRQLEWLLGTKPGARAGE
jgi:CheY-like chemotaxis protein